MPASPEPWALAVAEVARLWIVRSPNSGEFGYGMWTLRQKIPTTYRPMLMGDFTHFDESGGSRMVDVTGKAVTARSATAEGWVAMAPETLRLIASGGMAKGDVCEVARLAGIMAAKQTPHLIPLCHPLPVDGVSIDLTPAENPAGLRIRAEVRTTARTGVEMEALTAATVAGLTVYDMCKSVDRAMSLGPFELVEKTGGRSGDYQRPNSQRPDPRPSSTDVTP